MRERLFDLIAAEIPGDIPVDRLPDVDAIVDRLLSAGVIVPPFPIGTKYYRIVTRSGKYAGEYFVVRKAILNYYNIDSVLRDFGKTVFLTKEEAERALAERREG